MTRMSSDQAIKLFGRTIPLHVAAQPNPTAADLPQEKSSESDEVSHKESPKITVKSQQTDQTQTKTHPASPTQEPKTLTDPTPQPQTLTDSPPSPNESDKTLKKPDKILSCPRCNSMDTKFCYYNNYNVNQPRHFCKNCQRYWTAGGTMRNVPVGAGRRKNKHPNLPSNPNFRHVIMTSSPDPLLHQQQQQQQQAVGTGTVMKFGTEVPLCESMQSALSIKEEKKSGCNSEVINTNADEQQSSCNSSNEGGVNVNNAGPAMQCYPQGFMWGPAIPMPFMPASFWPGPWWTGFTQIPPSSPNSSSGSGSPTLGKHARETEENNEQSEKRNNNNNNGYNNGNNCNLWVPKTVRLVDPDEAARSSILATLGIKKDDKGFFGNFAGIKKDDNKGIFGNFAGKEMGRCDAGPVLNANPAALSRFQSFQERT